LNFNNKLGFGLGFGLGLSGEIPKKGSQTQLTEVIKEVSLKRDEIKRNTISPNNNRNERIKLTISPPAKSSFMAAFDKENNQNNNQIKVKNLEVHKTPEETAGKLLIFYYRKFKFCYCYE